MQILKFSARAFAFIFLTILTQVGGVVYLVNFASYRFINARFQNHFLRRLVKVFTFLFLYLAATFLIVPFLAEYFGRVALPTRTTNNLRPLNVFTCLLNRNYVNPELRDITFNVAVSLNRKYPGTIVNYLDAGFPFINKFPLVPHLSHNDGKKLDLAFFYSDSKTDGQSNDAPSFIGYGISEEPASDEFNVTIDCERMGYRQYSLMRKIMPQGRKKDFEFDEKRTRDMINLFAEKRETGMIFIEPHLAARLHLVNQKIRFHGCQAVRHDDHLHVQLK